MNDYSELKKAAEAITPGDFRTPEAWEEDRSYSDEEIRQIDFCALATPEAVLALIAENEAMRKDAERLNWLDIRSAPVVEGQCMGQPEGELAGYQWGVFGQCSTVREAIDYAMEGELDHG